MEDRLYWYEIPGYEKKKPHKAFKLGSGAAIYVPLSWLGHYVIAVRCDAPEQRIVIKPEVSHPEITQNKEAP